LKALSKTDCVSSGDINIGYNVGSYTQAGSFPILSTKNCPPKYKFPVNEAPKPGLRVAEVVGRIFVT
jgi:hypothetical protein